MKKYGPYRMVWFCQKCHYFVKPFTLHDGCCPECGEREQFKTTPGRYMFEETVKGFWIFKRTIKEIVGFSIE